ncbi:MAG: hydrolase [Nitrososphaeraceae archaeon]
MTSETLVSNKIHSLLTPDNCTLIMIDFQPQMAFGVKSIDGQTLINNAEGLAKSAKIFNVPTILTTVAEKSFSGPMFPQIKKVFPDKQMIDRTTMNCWEDQNVVREVERIGRKKLVLAGLWTEVCIVLPAIQAIEAGYEIYVIADACGGTSNTAHDMAIERLIQAGAVPMTWLQFLLELQRDWARTETYDAVMKVVREDAGTYGLGVEYAKAMLGEHAREG